jgi:hypothetical protein
LGVTPLLSIKVSEKNFNLRIFIFFKFNRDIWVIGFFDFYLVSCYSSKLRAQMTTSGQRVKTVAKNQLKPPRVIWKLQLHRRAKPHQQHPMRTNSGAFRPQQPIANIARKNNQQPPASLLRFSCPLPNIGHRYLQLGWRYWNQCQK